MPSFCSQLKWHKQTQCLACRVPANIHHWLFDSASLTEKLINNCAEKFSVELIAQTHSRPNLDELRLLNLGSRQVAVVRQVLLYCDNQPWVYARTVIPLSTLKGSLRRLVSLGNQPLGAVLFADKSIARGEVEVAIVKHCHQISPSLNLQQKEKIWGRRSIFYKGKNKLLVSEFFLPNLIKT